MLMKKVDHHFLIKNDNEQKQSHCIIYDALEWIIINIIN